MNKILIAKDSCEPLYRRGDRFIITKRNADIRLMPIEAMRLKDKQIYGFEEEELEEKK